MGVLWAAKWLSHSDSRETVHSICRHGPGDESGTHTHGADLLLAQLPALFRRPISDHALGQGGATGRALDAAEAWPAECRLHRDVSLFGGENFNYALARFRRCLTESGEIVTGGNNRSKPRGLKPGFG